MHILSPAHDLSIIIVNYRSSELAIQCIQSIIAESIGFSYQIIVVDNSSGDYSEARIALAFPDVLWIQMGYNAGFARANNEGIRQATGDTILLLNPDTIIQDNAIGRCYQAFRVSKYLACGVQLLNEDRTPQISGSYFMAGALNNLLPLPYLGRFVRWLGSIFHIEKPHVSDSSSEVEVDWINGAFLMFKTIVVGKVGLLDEDFFLYAEEVEWCSRINKIGRQVIFGQFKVIHLQGETANDAFRSIGKGYYNVYDKKGLQIMLSNLVRIRKQFGAAWFLFHLLIYTFNIPLYFIVELFQVIFSPINLLLRLSLVRRYTGNIARLWTFFIPIIFNRPFFYKVL